MTRPGAVAARVESSQKDGGAYFALAMERRLWRGNRSVPRQFLKGRYPPNRDVRARHPHRPLNVDTRHPLPLGGRPPGPSAWEPSVRF